MRALRLLPFLLPLTALPFACAHSGDGTTFMPSGSGAGGESDGSGGSGNSGPGTGGSGGLFESDGGFITDASDDAPLSQDAACAAVSEEAQVEKLPVDIIWMVDNSSSMAPAVTQVTKGLNNFAATIAAKNLDYKVIMLSLRSKDSPITVSGSTRYPVCIPPPLAGDANCGNSPRFFQSSIDIKSTQPLEQFLGTLAQTSGYAQGEAKGGEPWQKELRPKATKTIVIVTDDNSRLTADQFEHFAGGKDPWNTTTLPPGILDPSWNGLFDGYVFSGLYGWSSDPNPNTPCTYPDGTQPPSSGLVYTTLMNKTGGVRAQLCQGSNAWGPFFDAVAQAVDSTAKLSCELTIPKPPSGDIDPSRVSVALVSGGESTYLPNVSGVGACDPGGGWYYDDLANPKKVVLCKSSCDQAQAMVGPDKPGSIQVLFGCQTIPK